MANYTPYPDEATMRKIRRYMTGAGAGMLGAAGTVASMNPLGGLLAIAGSAYPSRAEAPTEPIGPPLTNEQMWALTSQATDNSGGIRDFLGNAAVTMGRPIVGLLDMLNYGPTGAQGKIPVGGKWGEPYVVKKKKKKKKRTRPR
jgi:hypothetical protein